MRNSNEVSDNMEDIFLGVEIGGTKQQIILGTSEGKLLEKISEKVNVNNGHPIYLTGWTRRFDDYFISGWIPKN